MQSVVEIAGLVLAMAFAFAVALLVEWVLLHGIFRALAVGLRPAVEPALSRERQREIRNAKFRRL